MPDKGKVVAGLQCCIVRKKGDNRRCRLCPYRDPSIDCTNLLHIDALALLDEDTVNDCKECGIDA